MRNALALTAILTAILTLIACSSPSPTTPSAPVASPTPVPTPGPIWTASGVGDNVFTMPNISRVRIQASYPGRSSNFVVRLNGRLLVNELLGTAWGTATFDGTYLANGGGTTEIVDSSGVAWTFTEVR